jgi:hypothetical protein
VQNDFSEPAGWDPLGFGVDLPLDGCFHPFGFPFHLATNSPDVLRAAEESWGGFPPAFSAPPVQVRVAVREDDGGECASGLLISAQRHLAALISDRDNFAICDLPKRFAFCRLTPATARDRAWFRYYLLDTIANLILWDSHLTRVHAGCVALDGRGVLFCGDSGAGKSCLVYACASNGWTLITDEAASLLRRSDERIVLGKPKQIHLRETAFELFPELNGRVAKPNPVGKLTIEVHTAELPHIKTAFQCRAEAVVFLKRQAGEPARLVPLARNEAWQRLVRKLPLFEQPAHDEHKQSLRKLVEAGTYELHYEDLDSAVRELERMMRQGGRL